MGIFSIFFTSSSVSFK